MPRSACPARRNDGRREPTGHPGAPGLPLLPTQTHHAKVRFSWTKIRSSNKTPTRRNATREKGRRFTLPFGQEDATFLSADRHPGNESATLEVFTPHELPARPKRGNLSPGRAQTRQSRDQISIGRPRSLRPSPYVIGQMKRRLSQELDLVIRALRWPERQFSREKTASPPHVLWHDIAKSNSPNPIRLGPTTRNSDFTARSGEVFPQRHSVLVKSQLPTDLLHRQSPSLPLSRDPPELRQTSPTY